MLIGTRVLIWSTHPAGPCAHAYANAHVRAHVRVHVRVHLRVQVRVQVREHVRVHVHAPARIVCFGYFWRTALTAPTKNSE